MILYRLCNVEEVDTIFREQSMNNIGSTYNKFDKNNTYNYKKRKSYVHFFFKEEDLLYLGLGKGKIICTYNIDDDLVNNNKCIGTYADRYTHTKEEKIEECVIENSLLTFSNLEKVDLVTDYVDINTFNYKAEADYKYEIYNKEIPKTKLFKY